MLGSGPSSVRRVVGPLAAVPVAQALLATRVRIPVGLRAGGGVRLGRLPRRSGGRCRGGTGRRLRVRLLLRRRRRLRLTGAIRLARAERSSARSTGAAARAAGRGLALFV